MNTLKKLLLLSSIAIMTISCCDCPSGDPQNIITEAQAIQMDSLYIANQHRFVNMGIEQQYQNGEPDNLGALIEIDDFQKYLIAVKKEAQRQNKPNPAIKLSFGAQLDENEVPRSAPFFMAIYPSDSETEDPTDLVDYKQLEFPMSFYDKLDPMNKDPKPKKDKDN